MNTYACLIVPRDLLERILSSNQKSGWFSGLRLKAERVFVAIQCRVNNEEVTSTNGRLLTHRAANTVLGAYKEELLQWVAVDAGFHNKYSGWIVLSKEEYAASIGLELTDERLCFGAIEPSEDGPILSSKVATRTRDGGVRLFPAESIVLAAEATPLARLNKEMIESLKDHSVMIVGAGSGGSEISLNLACSGVGKLELVDHDRLHPENYVRFPAGMQELGRHKVDVVRSMIHERELSTVVKVHHVDVVRDADEFRGLFSSKFDLIICATDSIASRRLVNCTAVQMNIPCIIAGTLDHGKIGEVLRVEPYKLPCYECVRLELGAVLDQPPEDDGAATPYLDTDERQLGGSALRMDVIVPAALASHVALQILDPARFPSTPAPYMVWGREASRHFSQPFQFEYPFATNFVPLKRRKDCPVCGALPTELVGMDVAQRVGEILAEADQASA